jgi:hypothetical protein
MADERKPFFNWTANDICSVIAAIAAAIAMVIGAWNNTKIGDVQTRQVETEREADDVKIALESAAQETSEKLRRIEKSSAVVESRIQVMGSPKSPGQ